ncbi:MAG: hypothetical protein HAW67_07855 [Endozoicomonadaceae bacterium]|nr:hypothetical protein [Endozoicomonadaceae bacterium]
MKTFCILEQGCSTNDPLTIKKKDLFTTKFSDFFRLNWKQDDDPNAFIHAKEIVWSEGRSLLYDQTPKDYRYYIFTDDDIEFSAQNGDVAQTIKNVLEEYQPLTGTFLDIDRFTNTDRRNFIEKQALDDCLSRRAFPISGYDQQVQIYASDYAEVMFPTIYHGSGGAMWYSQWVCYQQFPGKQLCFTDVNVVNTRKDTHNNDDNTQHSKIPELISLFNYDLIKGEYDIRGLKIIENNCSIFPLPADKTQVTYSLNIFYQIYDIYNNSFINRLPMIKNKRRYLEEIEQKVKLIQRPLHGAQKLPL